MKILIVSEMSVPYATGGGEVRYALLSRQLAAAGHEVTWLSMAQRDSGADTVVDGVRHLHRGPRISRPPLRPLHAKLRFMLALLGHLLRQRYDVVDCQTYAPLPAARLACLLAGMPLVATIHDTAAAGQAGDRAEQWLSAPDRVLAALVEAWLYRLHYDRVLTVSKAVARDLTDRLGVRASRVCVVPNAIDIDHIDAITAAADRADLIFVGRLVPHKRPRDFLLVAAAINRRRRAAGRPALRLKLVGGGPLAAEVRACARDLGLERELVFLGELASHAEVIAHLKSARVLVLPSMREGFGLVLAEAMASHVAVAAYSLPPVVETLGPALQACLAPPAQVEALAQIVESLVDDEARHAECTRQGRERVEAEFGAHRFTRDVLEVYKMAARPAT